MKNLFNSFFSRILNFPNKNESTFTASINDERKTNIEISDLTYEDYLKYSIQRPRRKPTRLIVD